MRVYVCVHAWCVGAVCVVCVRVPGVCVVCVVRVRVRVRGVWCVLCVVRACVWCGVCCFF
jgi:hypothetical protein